MITLFVITIILALLLIKPYLTAILTSLVLAYIFYPAYEWLNGKLKRKNLSAFIISIIIILLITIPLSFILYEISKEANVGYIILKQKIVRGTLFDLPCTEGLFCTTTNKLKELTAEPEVRYYLQDSLQKAATYVAEGAFNFIFSIPRRLLGIFLTFFITFFLLRDGEEVLKKLESATPLEKKQRDRIFKQLHEVTRAITYGFFVVAIIEGILGAITFKLFGVSSPIIWGVVIGILALIPFIGAAIIWIPAVIIQLFHNNPGAAIGITIGGLIISSIDTFIKPKIIGKKAAVHPILIILGFLGGIKLLGFIGIIIGPLILALLVTFIKMYKKGR